MIYDTQLIVERASNGLTDIPGHAMDLFMDLFSLFVRIAIIFLERENNNNRRGRRRRDDDDNDNNNRRWRSFSSRRRSRF